MKKSVERQEKIHIPQIRPDHVGRYTLASNYCKRSDLVLDFGCGTGYGSRILSKDCKMVHGIDVSKDTLNTARISSAGYNVRFYYHIPMGQLYDMSVMFEVIEHVDNPVEVLNQVVERTKSGGTLVISTPDQSTQPYSKEKFPYHKRHYTQDEFESLISECDLKLIIKFTQHKKMSYEISHGFGGLFNIAVCEV